MFSASCAKLSTQVRLLRTITTASSHLTNSSAVAGAEKTVYPDGWDSAKAYNEIPGPNVFQLFRAFMPGGEYNNATPAEFQTRVFDKYGSLVRLPGMLGKPDMLLSCDPAHFEAVYRTEGIWPMRRGMAAFTYYRTEVRPEVFKGMGGLVSDQGEPWQKLRSAVNPVMMAPRVSRSYVPAVDAVSRDFLRKVHLLRDANDELPATFGNELNLWALESIGTIALDRRLGVMAFERDADADLLIKTVKDFFQLSYDIEMKPAFWRYYQTKEFKQLMTTFDNMTRLAMKYVNEALEDLEKDSGKTDGENRTSEMSVLQKLLSVNRDYAVLMTFDMLFAGIDTTSSTSATLLYQLAKNPAEQEKLREEVLSVLPDKEAGLERNALDQMPYMRACLKESMRIQPIIQGHMRGTGQPLIINGYQIPYKTDFVMATLLMMTDEEHFKDANKFMPERWLRDATGKNPLTKDMNPFAFLPFGFGTRSCVGRRFAEMEVMVLITRILREYRIEWHHGPMEYATALIVSPSSDLKFKFIPL